MGCVGRLVCLPFPAGSAAGEKCGKSRLFIALFSIAGSGRV